MLAAPGGTEKADPASEAPVNVDRKTKCDPDGKKSRARCRRGVVSSLERISQPGELDLLRYFIRKLFGAELR
jgi:hypothetical protein